MKNSLLLLLSIFTIFASCSSDDDGDGNDSSSNDPIIGRWNIYQIMPEEGDVVDAYTFPCINNTYLDFTPSGLTWVEYYLDLSGNCLDSTAETIWENRDGTYYINHYPVDIEINGNILSFTEETGITITYRNAD